MKTKAHLRVPTGIDAQVVAKQSIAETVASVHFFSHDLTSALTPPAQRGHTFMVGQLLAPLPFLVFILPFLMEPPENVPSGVIIALVLVIILITILALGLVGLCRTRALEISRYLDKIVVPGTNQKFNVRVQSLLSMQSQLVWGGLIAVAVIFLVLLQVIVINQFAPFSIFLFVFGAGYVGLIWGTALYAVFSIPELLGLLTEARFEVQALYPYQQPEFRKVSESAASITVTGGWFTTILITLLVIGQFVVALRFSSDQAVFYLFLAFLEVAILLCAFLTLGILFSSFNTFISILIKQAKAERIEKFNAGMQYLLREAQKGDAEAAEQIKKIQSLIDQIDRSPNSVLGVGTAGKLFSSILLTILPILISQLLTR